VLIQVYYNIPRLAKIWYNENIKIKIKTMKKNEDRGRFFLGLLLVVASVAWIFFMGYHMFYMFVLLAGIVLMLASKYRII